MDEITYRKIEEHKDVCFPLTVHDCSVDENHGLLPHYHDDLEILFVKSGRVRFEIGGRKILAQTGDVLFSNMYQVHSAEHIDPHPARFAAIVFDKRILEAINVNSYHIDYIKPYIDGARRFPEAVQNGDVLHKQVSNYVTEIIDEYAKKDTAYEVFVISSLERLFAIFERYGETEHKNSGIRLGSANREFLEKLVDYIRKNHMTPIRLEDVSIYFNFNKHHICRLIKKFTGRSLTQLVNIYRIRQAEILLLGSALSVYEIAERTGFQNLSYFNRTFLKYTGTTPSGKRAAHCQYSIDICQ